MTEVRKLERFDVVIIGAGTMGLSTAYRLKDTGKKVLLLDQYKVKNDLNSSQDYSRSFRVHYGDDEFLSKMAYKARQMWFEAEEKTGGQFFYPAGKLLLAEEDDGYAYQCHEVMRKLGMPSAVFRGKQLKERFPQFRAGSCVLDASGGVLDAYKYLEVMLREVIDAGVEVREETRVESIEGKHLRLENGDRIVAESLVVTAGAWVQKLIDVPAQVTRQQILYLKPKNPFFFTKGEFPIFSYMEDGYYGIPIHGIQAVKVANHHPGLPADADSDSREIDPNFVEKTRDWLSKYIPRLASAELVQSKVCMYTGTHDRNFIIDNLDENTVIATGFSGHGFKFSPLIGQIVADLALHGVSRHGIEPWGLQRFANDDFAEKRFANAL
jgi:monomeric sarcosine oxidase